jgi:hypothetical protein
MLMAKTVSLSVLTFKEKKTWSTILTTSLTLGCAISALFAGGLVSKNLLILKVQIRQIKNDKVDKPSDDCGHRHVHVPLQ